MLSTDKISCNILADLLSAHGVRDIVFSPGSRNAPLIIAFSRRDEYRKHVVVDERSAAFMALGMAVESFRPVAIVCTSGTALLNYSPAVAEAYYRGIPLIVISADRPEEWIDQDDSQTIRQRDALAPYVKRSADISAHLEFTNGEWSCNRMINDVLLDAVSGRRGPVHINIRLDAPLNQINDFDAGRSRVIRMIEPNDELPTRFVREMGEKIASPKKVLVVAGFLQPDERLNRALIKLSNRPNVVVMTETIANLHCDRFIGRIDMTLSAVSGFDRERLKPDVIITLGGALVSRHVKEWIRSMNGVEHWHVGHSHTTVDCFRHLSLRVELDPAVFFRQLASAMQIHNHPSDYYDEWMRVYKRAALRHDSYVDEAPWSDMKAFGFIIPKIPRTWNLQLSNGTPIRYAQLMDCSKIHRCDCNRGVSGIDGCTSTAVGASVTYGGTTLLVTGDMSCQYDISALSSALVTPRFKMIVINNGGGGIFRFIKSTASLPELERFFAVGSNLPLRHLADGYGFSYFEANDEETLKTEFGKFVYETEKPTILSISTPAETSAKVLKQYFEQD